MRGAARVVFGYPRTIREGSGPGRGAAAEPQSRLCREDGAAPLAAAVAPRDAGTHDQRPRDSRSSFYLRDVKRQISVAQCVRDQHLSLKDVDLLNIF